MNYSKYYLDRTAPFSEEQVLKTHEDILSKNTDAWHQLMGNITQHSKDSNYRNLVKKTCLLQFKDCREDIAFFALSEEEYHIIFPKIVIALYDFFDDDIAFQTVSSNIHRDARFDYHDFEKTLEFATNAANAENILGLCSLTYIYYFGLGVEQDKEKAFDLVDKTQALSFTEGTFLKAFLFHREGNLELAKANIEEIKDYDDHEVASAIDTLKAEIIMEKEEYDFDLVLSHLNRAIKRNQSSYPYFILGRAYLYGNSALSPNIPIGIEYFQKSFEMGNSNAGLFLGYYFAYNAEETDLQKGLAYCKTSATYYNMDAKYELGKMYAFHDKLPIEERKKGVEILDKIKEKHPPAYVDLAFIYIYGEIEETNLDKTYEYLKAGVESKYGYAAYQLGRLYESNTLVEDEEKAPHYDKALYWYERGQELNNIESIEMMGRYYRIGIGVEADPKEALKYIQRGIQDFDSNYCKTELAECYESGFGVEENYQKAFELFQDAAKSNYPYAVYQVGLYHRDGVLNNDQPNYDESYLCFSKAAQLGFGLGHYELAKAIYHGEGVVKDTSKGVEMLKENLENNIFDAAIDLANHYESDDKDENPELAVEYMQKAVEGSNNPYSLFKMGYFYYAGYGVEIDKEKAKNFFADAAQNGYIYANIPLGNIELWEETPDSSENNAFEYYQKAAEYDCYNYGLGMCYKYGIGVGKNAEKAYHAFKKGTEEENVIACYHLGLCYLYGDGTQKNEKQAFDTFNSVAMYDNDSKHEAAMLYMKGVGVSQNTEIGIQYLQELANDEHTESQFVLGNAYLVGNGVAENNEKAIELLKKAAQSGHKQAKRIVRTFK